MSRKRKHDNEITFTSEYTDEGYKLYQVKLMINNEEKGYFSISKVPDNKLQTHPYSLNISIDDDYQKKGYSRRLIYEMCEYIKNNFNNDIDDKTELYIDADASVGFWDKIGMIKTTEDDKYNGYEKKFTFGDLCNFGNNKKQKYGGKSNKSSRINKTRKITNKSTKKRNKIYKGGIGDKVYVECNKQDGNWKCKIIDNMPAQAQAQAQNDNKKYCYKNINPKLDSGEKKAVKISDIDLYTIKNNCDKNNVECTTTNMLYCENDNCNNCQDAMWKTIDQFNIENIKATKELPSSNGGISSVFKRSKKGSRKKRKRKKTRKQTKNKEPK